ncbi:hypothetical protein MIMGU_mgv1a010992mg [Erythranthe guttata]|uniref:PPM-type phosphatase domain-containing protein n=1 Tax=Erythranthe guttata TaxID=4155 RepID=A0A022QUX1_ERYGU|nr:hypothetical protein MIMGU_mgv1a010992mg [Erythranthe guttata]
MVSYSNCEFSTAVLEANAPIEDYSHVVIGKNATFVGIYDGHCGTEAANYLKKFLFNNLLRISGEKGWTMSGDMIKQAISETEEGFIDFVRQSLKENRRIVNVGSCCMVGIIWDETLYVANLGNSKTILGNIETRSTSIRPLKLAYDQPRNPKIRHACRCMGNASVKYPEEFDLDSDNPKTVEINLVPTEDKFVIFASHGLWEFLSNEEAVKIVQNKPRRGIAKRLIKSAMKVAAKRKNVTYKELKRMYFDSSDRKIHNDITVIVVFFKYNNAEPPSFPLASFEIPNNPALANPAQ